MEMNEFLNRLAAVKGGIAKGKDVVAAAGAAASESNDNPVVVAKAVAEEIIKGNETEANRAQTHFELVQKSFDYMARVNPELKGLGATAVMDDPLAYLRAKDPVTQRFIVPDFKLNKMLATLMARPEKVARDGGAFGFGEWSVASKNSDAVNQKFDDAIKAGKFGGGSIAKALDTTSGSALIRTDLEPLLYEAYLRQFPAEEFIQKIPANGLVHTYNQITAMGAATFISELGDMSAAVSNSTFTRAQSTAIAIAVAPRAISLKAQYAIDQSGMNFGIPGGADGNTEITSAMRAIAKLIQTTTFQGNADVAAAAGTLNTEDGLYNVNAFTGFRRQLKGASTSITKGGSQTYRDVIDQAVAQVINAGGVQENLMIFLSLGGRRVFNGELESSFLKIENTLGNAPFDHNLSRGGMFTVSDYLTAFMNVPAGAQAEGIGYYEITPGTPLEDEYIMDPAGLAYAYLGSPMPTVLELPIGFNHQLSRVFYPFVMRGLVIRVLGFNRKVRIPQQVV